MLTRRRAAARGHTDWGWLDSRHTFSFGEYHDPAHEGFHALRVINDDRVKAGAGFGTHGHRDMEILSYVLEGGLAHKDSMGTGSVIRPGEIQFMRAGTGVTHSEFNESQVEPVHFLQIWIVPNRRGLPPAYAQQPYDRERARKELVLLASSDGRGDTIRIQENVDLYVTLPSAGERRVHELAAGRHGWVQVAKGAILLNGTSLDEGDGAAVSDESRLEVEGREPSEILVFDLG